MLKLIHQRGYYYIKDDTRVIERHRNQSKATRRFTSLSRRASGINTRCVDCPNADEDGYCHCCEQASPTHDSCKWFRPLPTTPTL